MQRRYLRTPLGAHLAVHDSGPAAGSTLLLVHGFPDDHRLWDGVSKALRDAGHRVVSYDTRGSGDSCRPRRVRDYTPDTLASDLQAVVDDLAPQGPVHLVGHDWGAVQGWHLITGAPRGVASFTAVAAPYPGHLPGWIAEKLRRRRWSAVAQLWKMPLYMGFLQLPLVSSIACRAGLVDASVALVSRLTGTRASDAAGNRPSARRNAPAVRIYAAQVLPGLVRGHRRGPQVPTQALAPRHDAFIAPISQMGRGDGELRWQSHVIDGGHWAPLSHPDDIADRIRAWADRHDDRTETS